ncbi:A-kinase-interacting protein 1 isoform X3 [Lampris incognitus]|uniref:A-kinase-interacting protein 1 isoform X3 n=1 Tax=Lampris incognitus TaxID=2546036 RepID=UPI0024B499B0|nr:A-kinase-interacting protein 1 isoform X3 [Lampris incognitus]
MCTECSSCQNWLDSSLRRSALLGQEVLRRASRRSVDWTSTTSTSQTPTSNQDDRNTLKRTHTNLHDAFGTIAEFMAQTTHQCKNFYDSEHCETSNIERNHVSRFHTQPTTGTTMSALSTRKHGPTPSPQARQTQANRPSWLTSRLERVSTSPLTSEHLCDYTSHF